VISKTEVIDVEVVHHPRSRGELHNV
jgi:hypothetical protein